MGATENRKKIQEGRHPFPEGGGSGVRMCGGGGGGGGGEKSAD